MMRMGWAAARVPPVAWGPEVLAEQAQSLIPSHTHVFASLLSRPQMSWRRPPPPPAAPPKCGKPPCGGVYVLRSMWGFGMTPRFCCLQLAVPMGLSPLTAAVPNPRFLHGPLPGWGYGSATFQLGIWTGPALYSFISFVLIVRLIHSRGIGDRNARFAVRLVCGPLGLTWGAPLGEDESGVKVGMVNTKVAHQARVGQTPHQGQDLTTVGC